VQETTFNQETQEDGSIRFSDVHSWLNAFYSEASLKKFDQSELYHIISHNISFGQLEKRINYKFKVKNYLIGTIIAFIFANNFIMKTLSIATFIISATMIVV
jgi:ribonuclease-3